MGKITPLLATSKNHNLENPLGQLDVPMAFGFDGNLKRTSHPDGTHVMSRCLLFIHRCSHLHGRDTSHIESEVSGVGVREITKSMRTNRLHSPRSWEDMASLSDGVHDIGCPTTLEVVSSSSLQLSGVVHVRIRSVLSLVGTSSRFHQKVVMISHSNTTDLSSHQDRRNLIVFTSVEPYART